MSTFFARKVKTYFKHLDQNDDGFVSLNDFVDLAEHQCDAEDVEAVQREKLKESCVKIWRKWMTSAGSDDNGLLTASIFVESVKQQRSEPDFKEAYLEVCHDFFALMDVNGDGFLQEDEYAKSLADLGIQDTSIIRRSFDSIDLNGDGKLSLYEISTALWEYMTSEDENSPYVLVWGPLVE